MAPYDQGRPHRPPPLVFHLGRSPRSRGAFGVSVASFAEAGGTEHRGQLIAALERLWRHDPELRFGQMLMQALTTAHYLSVDVDLTSIGDLEARVAIAE